MNRSILKKGIISLFVIFSTAFSCPVTAYPAEAAREPAEILYSMGLFVGTGTDASGGPVYELDRAPTRQEAAVMLVRLLGKEPEAAGGAWTHPFSDVDAWADKYVGYAYTMGLVLGVEDNKLGAGQEISAAEYLTFVLRALGYSDSKGDFSWKTANVFSAGIGLTSGEYGAAGFTRGDIAEISLKALSQKLKNTDTSLIQSLVNAAAVTKAQAIGAGLQYALDFEDEEPEEGEKLSAEEIYSLCAPAVFYLEIYNSTGRATASGSGFFISAEGIAVTNYHVIKGASSIRAYTSDGGIYDVRGVYDFDEETDLAIIKVEGEGFEYLEAGDSKSAAGGAAVYAIGSPLGLSNTISEGIISNPKRVINGREYIQVTSPISSGSSGGALINALGKVIGVTSASVAKGQNINLAVPIHLAAQLSTETVKSIASAGL